MQTKNKRIILYLGFIFILAVAVYLVVRFAFSSNPSDPLQLSLEAPREITIEQVAVFKLHVKNVSKQATEFDLGGQPPHGFIISNSIGTDVWNSREAGIVQDMLGHQKLGAGKEAVFETTINTESWNPLPNVFPSLPLPKTPGVYFIRGELHRGQNDPVLRTPSQELEIQKAL